MCLGPQRQEGQQSVLLFKGLGLSYQGQRDQRHTYEISGLLCIKSQITLTLDTTRTQLLMPPFALGSPQCMGLGCRWPVGSGGQDTGQRPTHA